MSILTTISLHHYLWFEMNATRFIFAFSFSIFICLFSDNETPGSHYLNVFTYLINHILCIQSLIASMAPASVLGPFPSTWASVPRERSPSYTNIFFTPHGLWNPLLLPPHVIFPQPCVLTLLGSPLWHLAVLDWIVTKEKGHNREKGKRKKKRKGNLSNFF